MIASVEQWPLRHARICGLLYLLIIGLGLFGEAAVRAVIVAGGDPAATATNLAANELLWRAGIVGDLLMHAVDVPTIIILYLLLRPVSNSLALLATAFNIVQTSVLAINKLFLLAPLLMLQSPVLAASVSEQQLHGLGYFAIQLHGFGFAIGLVFFGFTCLIRGYLIFRSDYLPKALGVLLALAGASYIVNTAALLLAPDLAALLFPAVLLPAFVGELCLAVWLLLKGVDLPRWRQRMEAARRDPSLPAGPVANAV